MEAPSTTTFKLSRHKKRGLFLTTILSALIGAGALYAAHDLKYGEGRFVFIFIGVFTHDIFLLNQLFIPDPRKFQGDLYLRRRDQ